MPLRLTEASRPTAEGYEGYQLGGAHIESLATNQKTNDESEKSQNRTEDLNDKNLDEPIKCVC